MVSDAFNSGLNGARSVIHNMSWDWDCKKLVITITWGKQRNDGHLEDKKVVDTKGHVRQG